MNYTVNNHEGRAVKMTDEQTERYEADDTSVIAKIAATLEPGDYSVYAAGNAYLAQNITVEA